jgi:hypothetical protein
MNSQNLMTLLGKLMRTFLTGFILPLISLIIQLLDNDASRLNRRLLPKQCQEQRKLLPRPVLRLGPWSGLAFLV